MKRIFKYELHHAENSFDIPCIHKVLKVGVQDGKVYLWAEIDDQSRMSKKSFEAVPTGGALPDFSFLKYAETVFLGPLVFHIYLGEE